MTLEEEVRAFAEKHIPNGKEYLSSLPVPAFGGHTWEEALTGTVHIDEKTQRAVLKRLHDLYGNKEPWGRAEY